MRKILLFIFCFSISSHAVDIKISPTQLRFFIGNQSTSPSQVNDVIVPAGLTKFSSIATYGIEATYAVIPRINLGVRGEGKWQKVKETASPSANPLNPYYASIQQSAALAILRIDLVNTPIVKVDVFGAAGTAATNMDIRTAAGDGNYSRGMSSIISNAGASLGIGWSNIYFLIEGGNEWNKVGNLTKTGATSAAIDTIDLSGGFVTVGLIFNGLPRWIHKSK
jgi:hypothetical protein